jgi:hypothetical protein
LKCNKTVDVIALLDGSGSLGKPGWKAEMAAAKMFISAFRDSGKANMAAVLYSGPRTWSGVKKCVGKSKNPVKPEACGIKIVSQFTEDLKKLDEQVQALEWPQGSTLTSLALTTAKAMLSQGRKTAPTIVVVFTDGRPLSFRNTWIAAHDLRLSARLVWVAITQYAPLKYIKAWSTRRWQENVVKVSSFADLGKAETITHIIADICPKDWPEIRFERGARLNE